MLRLCLWYLAFQCATGQWRAAHLGRGDTPSKFVDQKDRATALLFGDAGSATAVEVTDNPNTEAYHIMMTDGSGANDLIIPGGMVRSRFPKETSQYCLHMDGGHIFDFTRNRVPTLLADLLRFSGRAPQDYAYFVFHQANEYVNKFLVSKAGIDLKQVPFSIAKFGTRARPLFR